MKSIVIATDFSNEANNAMHYAAAAAQKAGSELILFHLHTISIHTVNARLPPAAIQHSLELANSKLKLLAEQISLRYNLNVHPIWAMGNFYDELKRTIDEFNAELVVMGMPEKSFEQDLLGNTTTSALNKLHIPVLAVPIKAKFEGISKILFASDRVTGFHQQVLDRISTTARIFGAEVVIFHVEKEIDELAQQTSKPSSEMDIASSFKDIQYTYKNVQSTLVIEAIQNEVLSLPADLLVMVPYRYGFWSALVHRSKTRAMASRSDVPLLSIPVL
jgi:nucleotide-binding universal stress UspA family protein